MFGKMDMVLATHAMLIAAGLLTAFIMHEGARKFMLAIKLSTAVHKDAQELVGGLIGALNIIFWLVVLVCGCVLMVIFFHLFQLDPKNLAVSILMGAMVSALAVSSGALSGYYDR